MARLFTDSLMKIMHGRLEPGASIGLHTHDTSSEVIYVLAGRGKVLCDGEWEAVSTGSCHYCPKAVSYTHLGGNRILSILNTLLKRSLSGTKKKRLGICMKIL